MKKILLLCAVFAAFAGSTAMAGFTPYALNGSSQTVNRGYVGLKWSTSGTLTPALVLGVVSANVTSDANTTGADLSVSLDMTNGLALAKCKISYMGGNNTAQGEVGLGYDFQKKAPLLGLGVNTPYLNVGADIYRNDYELFAQIDTLDQFASPQNCGLVSSPVGGTSYYQTSNCTGTQSVW